VAVTIRDVARRAGVSKAAVSYVLNGRTTSVKITRETQERIYAAARELDYHPNALARGLARRRMDTMVLIPQEATYLSVWSGFTSEMMQGISEAALSTNYDVTLHLKEEPSLDEEVAAATDGRADGALLWRYRDDPLAERLIERGFPIVSMFDRGDHPDLWYVDCDNVLGGRLATEYLLELGHRDILHLSRDTRSGNALDRLRGYTRALTAHGLPVRPDRIVDVGWEFGDDAPYRRVAAMLCGPSRPTAVFCWYDGVALRILRMVRELGLRVPEDISILGFDSTILCEHTDPPLTSVRQPVREMAACAVTLLAKRLNREPVEEPRKLFVPVLDIRSSCAPPRSAMAP
jgi:DNA-binding LacI/PurR family transcriptional regulator